MKIMEPLFVLILFMLYLFLWKLKKYSMIQKTGKSPEVFKVSSTSFQQYMYMFSKVLTVYIVLMIILHSFNVEFYSLFTRVEVLNTGGFNVIGFVAGLSGLAICLYSQIKMGNAWRVGIDEKEKTQLITSGLYKYIRNPTYLGLFIMNAGIWLIWPTWLIFLFVFSFYIFLEIQVRCEEDYLLKIHGQGYEEYKSKTKRYVISLY